MSKNPLKIVIVGHVDHGKSTLIGRLLYETGEVSPEKHKKIEEICAKDGKKFELAFMIDAFEEEVVQGLTIDTAQVSFRTKKRDYIVIDAPGHKEFLKNMVSGACYADAAILTIDAGEGVKEQSKRHGYLLSFLGIKQVVCVINKMDLVGYKESVYRKVKDDAVSFLRKIGASPEIFIPISSQNGDNIVKLSANMDWYKGMSVLDAIDLFKQEEGIEERPLRLPVQDVYKFSGKNVIVGRVESGSISVGEKVVFNPSNKNATVKSIEKWNTAEPSTLCYAGESVGILLEEDIPIDRGEIISSRKNTPFLSEILSVKLFWMGKNPLEVHKRYLLKLATQEREVVISSIDKIIDASNLIDVSGRRKYVLQNEIAEVAIRMSEPVAFDEFSYISKMGRVVLLEDGIVCGGGVISLDRFPDRRRAIAHEIKSTNIHWEESFIKRDDRVRRNRYRGVCIWLTGLSRAGKSTIAKTLEKELFSRGFNTYLLDGDNIRHGLNSDLGFSPEDRFENIRRVIEVARLFCDAGVVAITSFISPYRDDRSMARDIIGKENFIEVFISCPIEECAKRDTLGLYVKAKSGEIQSFTGISAPYEEPEQPEIVIKTNEMSVERSVGKILSYLKKQRQDMSKFIL